MKFSLSINVALTEYPVEERIRLAAEIGYEGVDIYGNLDIYDPDQLRRASETYGIPVNSCCVLDAFENTLNKRWSRLAEPYCRTVELAKKAGIRQIAVLGGFKKSDFDDPKMLIIENAKRLAELGEKNDITFLLEPINNVIEHQTAYVHTSAMGAEIVNAVCSEHFKLLFDFIHLETAEGNVLNNALEHLDIVSLFHLVGIPGHDEPFHSQLDYPYILSVLAEKGFDGFVGAEYAPSYDAVQSAKDVLKYMKSYQTRKDMYRNG